MLTKRWSADARLLAIICLLAVAGCRPVGSPPPEKAQKTTGSELLAAGVKSPTASTVRLALNWFPEAEHGGYYAALVHGYFHDAGLDVTILPGGPNAPVIQRVAGDEVAFGVENADRILLGRAQEADVVAVFAPLQKSPRGILVHRKSGFRRIEGIADVRLAVNSGAAWVQYLKRRVPFKGVQFVPYSGNVTQFLLNPDYAQQAYAFSEPFVAKEQGADADCLLVAETGFNPYTSVLLTSEKQIRRDPDVVRRFVAACVRGWQTYLDSPAETNRRLHEINPEMSLEILEFGAKALRPLCADADSNAKGLGQMTLTRWQTLTDQLVDAEALKANAVDPPKAFTTDFLP